MKLESDCILCLFQKEMKRLDGKKEPQKLEYTKMVLKEFLEDQGTPPEYQHIIDFLHKDYWGDVEDIYTEPKKEHNQLLQQEEEKLWKKIEEANDGLEIAIKLAGAGNYVDMAVMDTISIPHLLDIIEEYIKQELCSEIYSDFCKELENAKTLVYLTDNCGEVVLDRLLMKTLKREFPKLNIVTIVKGGAVYNDVTMEDALSVGLDEFSDLMDNGIPIAGTCLNKISQEALNTIHQADLILSKGQANYETLVGSGLNIYYLFLCKCQHFENMLGLKKMSMVFDKERK